MLKYAWISILCVSIFGMACATPVHAEDQVGSRKTVALDVDSMFISLNFSTPNNDQLTLNVIDPLPKSAKSVTVTVGTITQAFTLDSTGFGSAPLGSFITSSDNFAVIILNGSLASKLPGLANASATNLPVSIPVSLQFGSTTASATVPGKYTATANSSGTFTSDPNTGTTGGGGGGHQAKSVDITSFTATPIPATVGAPVTFSATFSGHFTTGSTGLLLPGDGSSIVVSIDNLTSSKSGSVNFTYATPGAYQASLAVMTPTQNLTATAFVVVGQTTAVNPLNGMSSTVTVGNASATLSINVSRVLTATTASTSFSDTIGRDAPLEGLIVGRSYLAPTITVATTTALDVTKTPLSAMVRKMYAVSDRDVNNPSALPLPPSSALSKIKLAGKFAFATTKPDQVSFSGSIQLPAGYNPGASGGNVFVAGIGNVVGSAAIDAKGKATGTPTGGITKVSIKYPKLAGQALGGETASITVTFSAPGLSKAGFDTEGITSKLRPDEMGFKTVNRLIQTSFLLGGVKYEGAFPVVYKLASNASAGTISGRSAVK